MAGRGHIVSVRRCVLYIYIFFLYWDKCPWISHSRSRFILKDYWKSEHHKVFNVLFRRRKTEKTLILLNSLTVWAQMHQPEKEFNICFMLQSWKLLLFFCSKHAVGSLLQLSLLTPHWEKVMTRSQITLSCSVHSRSSSITMMYSPSLFLTFTLHLAHSYISQKLENVPEHASESNTLSGSMKDRRRRQLQSRERRSGDGCNAFWSADAFCLFLSE